MKRKASITRETKETRVKVDLNLEGSGKHKISTSISFFDHMLSLLAAHSLIDLNIFARGDTPVDDHHTVEDIGICLGKALKEALGDKAGIRRYGSAFIPMDESLASVHIDISGRPGLVYQLPLRRRKIGSFDTELVKEFFQALANNAAITIHAHVAYGSNSHHMVEGLFKALGRALRQAVDKDEKIKGVPSTKGRL
ncbi:MAG: imidazoleglycerol-phosphate dehydratase HisB [Thermodesulfobacteriota bacterium]